mgnify:CR=1 FL=1|jgi:hypothetical protein
MFFLSGYLGITTIQAIQFQGGNHMMDEKEIKEMIERSVVEFEHLKKIERVQYIMDFGKVYIQYDFCLN